MVCKVPTCSDLERWLDDNHERFTDAGGLNDEALFDELVDAHNLPDATWSYDLAEAALYSWSRRKGLECPILEGYQP